MDKKLERHYGLDVVRAIAITVVVLYHWPRHESQMIFRAVSHFGYLGVDLFFVLSGYLIVGQSLSLLKKGLFTPKRFYVSRLMRTLPNYFVVLAIMVAIYGLKDFDWRYLVFLQNIGNLYAFGNTWSLCVEEHFYLLLPFILLFLQNKNRMKHVPALVAGILIFEVVIRHVIWARLRPDVAYAINVDQGYEIYFQNIFLPSYTRMDGLALGALMAYTKNSHEVLWNKLVSRPNLFLMSSVVFFLPVAYLIYDRTGWINCVLGFTLTSLFSTGILLACMSEHSWFQMIKIPGITLISILSYSIYLTHVQALTFADQLGEKFGIPVIPLHLLRFCLVLGSALVLYYGLEKPVLKVRDRILKTL